MIVGWWTKDIEPKVLVRPKVTLGDIGVIFTDIGINILAELEIILGGIGLTFIDTGVNNCYFWLSIGLIIGLIDGVSYWGIRESNLDLKKIYVFNVWYIFLYL